MTQKPTYEELEQRVRELENAQKEHKQVLKTLKDSEERFRSITENSLVGFNIIQDDMLVYVNHRFADIFGYSVNECLYNMPFQKLVYQEDLNIVRKQVHKRMTGECKTVHYVFRGVRKSGEIVPLEIFGTSIQVNGKTAAVGAILDITAREQNEMSLQESERRFRDLIEGSIQGILIHRNHKPLFVNHNWASIHGYSPGEILSMETIVPLISKRYQKRMIKYKKARLHGEYAPDEYEYQGVHKDGSFIWLDNRVRTVNWEGTEAIQTTIFNITKRKQAEKEKELLFSDLKKAIGEIKTLHGLLPLCSYCKKIRDDKGYWNQIDHYIVDHSDANISHSICPDCAEKYHPDMDLYGD